MNHTTRGYVLHTRPYRESSQIVEAFTEAHGRLAFVAKGVKRKGGFLVSILQPFRMLTMSLSGRSDLKNLISAETDADASDGLLSSEYLYAGFYVNELLLKLLQPYDSFEFLFPQYQLCIARLQAQENLELTLRLFELSMLEELGFGLDLGSDQLTGAEIQARNYYALNGDCLLTKVANSTAAGAVSGVVISAIAESDWRDEAAIKGAKKLTRPLINKLLEGRELNSRKLFKQFKSVQGDAFR